MVLIMVTSWFPHDKANDVGKKYVELAKKYPPTPELGETLATAIKVSKEGIKSIGIAQVVKGKVEEFLAHNTKYMQEYAGIEGYCYEHEILMDVTEALAVIGMKPPEEAEVPEIY